MATKIRRKLDRAAYIRLAALWRKWKESDYAGERANAGHAFAKAAADYGFSVEYLERLVKGYLAVQGQASDRSDQSTSGPAPLSLSETIGALRGIILSYAILPEHADLILALWAALSYVYRRFMHSPRIVLDSAEPGCGKTTILDLLANVCKNGERCDDLSAASVYQHLDATHCNATVLIDEADNIDFRSDRSLLKIYNSGHRRGGTVWRGSAQGQRRRFPIFAPMAAAGIDASASFTRAMLERAIVFLLAPATAAESATLRKLNFEDADVRDELAAVRLSLLAWAREVERGDVVLNTSPEMPSALHNRVRDNWLPLVSIADAASPELGALARKVAVAMSKGRRSLSPGISLLFDSRAAFDEHHVDRFRSADLVRHFLENVGDVYRGEYEQWRGKNGDLSPRRLSQTALADTLARYSIFPRTIRFGPGKRDTAKGYFRADFEKAWRTWASHWKGQDQDDQTTTSLRVIRGDRRD